MAKFLKFRILTLLFVLSLGVSSRAALALSPEVKAELTALGLTPSTIQTIEERLWGRSIPQGRSRKIYQWLRGIGVRNPAKLIAVFPSVFGLSIGDNLEPKMAWLRSIGVKSPAKLVAAHPRIFGYSISDNLEPKMAWLRGIEVKKPAKLVEAYPSVFDLSIGDNLEPKVAWLRGIGVKSPAKLLQFSQVFSA